MANWFRNLGQIFGFSSAKRKQEAAPAQVYSPGKVSELEGGKTLLEKLEARARGEGVGYAPGLLDAYTSPLAKQAYGTYGRYEVPTISAQASSRGLGRSTIPIQTIARGQREVGENLNERLARLRIEEQGLIQQGITGALGGLQNVVTTGGQLGQRRAQENLNEFLRQQDIQEINRVEGVKGTRTALAYISSILDTVASKYGFNQNTVGVFNGNKSEGGGGSGGGASVNIGQLSQLLDLIGKYKK